MSNRLVELHSYGQSFWYDNIRRKFLLDGTLMHLIDHDGLRGMTSNPSIFDKAISESSDYDRQLAELSAVEIDNIGIYEALALTDIRAACDLFTPLYDSSDGGDGFVSLEVSPHLAHNTEGTLADARRLFAQVGRANVMIKVPATPEGIPAIRQLISEGINVNITLMFSMDHYEAVANAYIDGLREWLDDGGDPRKVASVASFFVSRVDSAVDNKLKALNDPAANALMGKVAIANSRLVYQRYKELFVAESGPFSDLRAAGGRVQRLLWASTSTKNPDYKDTMYIDELIGPDTVSTMPPETIDAFRDHGTLGNTLDTQIAESQQIMAELARLGIDMDAITQELQVNGVASFATSFDRLIESIDAKQLALTENS